MDNSGIKWGEKIPEYSNNHPEIYRKTPTIYASNNFSVLIENILNSDYTPVKDCFLTPEEKYSLICDLKRNHPGIEILTSLEEGDFFIQTIFTGIKELNDKYSQEFVDKLINTAKQTLIQELNKINPNNKTIWNDYKNFVIKINNELENTILEDIEEKVNCEIFNSFYFEKFETQYTKENFPLKIHLTVGQINNRYKKDKFETIILSLAKTKRKLEKKVFNINYGYISFGAQYKKEFKNNLENEKIILNKGTKNEEKHIIDIEKNTYTIIKKGSTLIINILCENELNPEIYKLFLDGKIPKELKLTANITNTYYTYNEKDIAKEKITYEGYEYIVSDTTLTIIDIETNRKEIIGLSNEKYNFFSIEILKKVRKNQIPKNLLLYKKIKNLISFITIDGEFVFPEWNNISSNSYKDKINDYIRIKNFIKASSNLEEVQKYLKTYYKSGVNRKTFEKEISTKEGFLIFYDIKDLGIFNIYAYLEELRKVKEQEQTLHDSKLNSGKLVTEIIKEMTNIPELQGHLYTKGGDEGIIFIENSHKRIRIIDELQKKAKKLGVQIRITTIGIKNNKNKNNNNNKNKNKNKNNNNNNNNPIEQLDKASQQIKVLENSIFSNIGKRIQKIKANLEKSLESLKEISIKDFKEHLNEKYNKLEENFDNISNLYLSSIQGKWYIVLKNSKIKFPLDKTIDKEGKLIPNSQFLKYLDSIGLGRQKKRD